MTQSGLSRVWLALWLLVNVSLVVWTNDLRQMNRETLFLTHEGNQRYDAFKAVVDERRVLAVKLEFEDGLTMTESLHDQLRAVYSSLKEKYPDERHAWMDFQDIYARAIGGTGFTAVKTFADANPGLLMPIWSARHGGFLLMMAQDISDDQVAAVMNDILRAPWPKGVRVFPAGLPYINYKLNEYANDIKLTLIPLMIALSVLLTLWLTNSPRATALLMIPAVFSLPVSLAVVKILYGSLTMVSAVIPLMMFVINLMICFHLFYAANLSGDFTKAWSVKKIPLILSVLTMAVGFAANYVSAIPVIRQFAVASTIAVLLTPVMSGFGVRVLMPLLLPSPSSPRPRNFYPEFFKKICPPASIWFMAAAICALCWVVAPRIQVVTDATRYFPESSGLRQAIERVEHDFLGTPAFEILARRDDGSDLTFEDHVKLHRLEGELAGAMGGTYKILSLGQLLREANRLFSGTDQFPPQRITWTMLQGGLPDSVRGAFPPGAVYRMSLMGSAMNGDVYEGEIAKLKNFSDGFRREGFTLEFNGLNYQLMTAQQALVRVMVEAFMVSLALVLLLFALTFRDARVIARFLVASLLPMACGVVAIYLFGFSLNIATVMTFSIALGMIVDNSFHLAWNIARGRAYHDYYADTIVPVVGSGVILGLGFAVFAVNGFLPIRQVGVLVAVMLVTGIAASLFVLPSRK
jgi:predicted RND superfamily exporter protein